MSDYKYSFIYKTGKTILDVKKYEAVGDFSEGLASVSLGIKGHGFIDKAGKEIIKPQFQQAGDFSEGFARIGINDKWGFIDKTGRVVIKPQYNWANGFSEGVTVVTKGNEVCVIDKAGQTILSRSMDVLQLNVYEEGRFSEGLIDAFDCVTEKNGFIDKTGKFVIEPKFDHAAPFSEGLARVTVEEDEEKLCFIDHSGQIVIPPTLNTDYDFRRNSTDFSEGLASVSEGLHPSITEEATFVYIDKKGAIVLFTNFFYAGPFRDGRASVYEEESGKNGYIDKTGKVVIPLKYDLAHDFSEGLACVAVHNSSR